MNESRRTAPIFIRRVGEKDFGHNLIRGGTVEQPRSLARDGVFFGFIGEGKNIRGEEDRRGGLRVARRLGETVVEASAAGSRDVGKNAVERHSSFFIRIEALVKKVAQKAPVLRDAFAVDTLCRSNGVGIVLGIGSKVTYGREASAGHDRVGDDIDVFVNLSGLEAAVQVNKPICRDELAIDGMRELPLGARNEGAPPITRVADREHVSRIIRARQPGYSIPPRWPSIRCPRGISGITFDRHQIAAQQAGDGLSVFFRDRGKKSQGARRLRIPLPPEAHDGVAVAQQPGVACVVGQILIAAVDQRENACIAAIGDLQKHGAIAQVGILRTDSDEVRGELDFAVLQVDRVAEIDDALVVRIGHGEREVDAPGDALVGPCISEYLAVENAWCGKLCRRGEPSHAEGQR